MGTPRQIELGRQFLDAFSNMRSSNPDGGARMSGWKFINAQKALDEETGREHRLHPLEKEVIANAAKQERLERELEARRVEEQKQKRLAARRASKRPRTYTRKARQEQREREARPVRRVYRRKR